MRVGAPRHVTHITRVVAEGVKSTPQVRTPSKPVDPRVENLLSRHISKVDPLANPAATAITNHLGNPPGGVISPGIVKPGSVKPGGAKPVNNIERKVNHTDIFVAAGKMAEVMRKYHISRLNLGDITPARA